MGCWHEVRLSCNGNSQIQILEGQSHAEAISLVVTNGLIAFIIRRLTTTRLRRPRRLARSQAPLLKVATNEYYRKLISSRSDDRHSMGRKMARATARHYNKTAVDVGGSVRR